MTLTTALVVLILFALLAFMGAMNRIADVVDLSAPFRNWSLARSARKLIRNGPPPEVVERRYWRARDYVRDAARLKALGYSVMTESITGPYITHPSARAGRLDALSDAVCPSVASPMDAARRQMSSGLAPETLYSDARCGGPQPVDEQSLQGSTDRPRSS